MVFHLDEVLAKRRASLAKARTRMEAVTMTKLQTHRHMYPGLHL